MSTNHALRDVYSAFKACAEEAPEGCYEDAKALHAVIGGAVDTLMRDIRTLGLKASGTDPAFDLEVAIYDYVRRSNPDATLFPVSEGFGSALNGPARERVLASAARDRDFLRSAFQVSA
jgi:hypothetical protein